jgi:hypothetical protein
MPRQSFKEYMHSQREGDVSKVQKYIDTYETYDKLKTQEDLMQKYISFLVTKGVTKAQLRSFINKF